MQRSTSKVLSPHRRKGPHAVSFPAPAFLTMSCRTIAASTARFRGCSKAIRSCQLTPKWSTKLAAYDVYIWDQCFALEQSLRID